MMTLPEMKQQALRQGIDWKELFRAIEVLSTFLLQFLAQKGGAEACPAQHAACCKTVHLQAQALAAGLEMLDECCEEC